MLVAPKSQLKQMGLFVGGALIALMSISLVLFSSIQSAVYLLVESNRLDSESAEVLHAAIRNGFIVMALFAVALVLYGAWVGFRMMHRFYGPTVPILRLLGELKAKKYDGRLRLRKGDELIEVAAAINELAAQLETENASDR